MKEILLNPENGILKQTDFNAGVAVYIINGDYKIASPILLPTGSELVVESGSLTFAGSKTDSPPNGIYLLCSYQTSIGSSSYSALCVTSRVIRQTDFKEYNGKYTPVYHQTTTKFLKKGDYIKNPKPDNFEMRLTTDCRIMLPGDTVNAKLYVLSDKINTIQIDGKTNFSISAENCKFERIFDCFDGMEMVYRVNASKNTLDGSNGPVTYPAINDRYSRFDNCEIFAEDFGKEHNPPNSNFLSIWTQVSNVVIQVSNNDYINEVNKKIRTLGIVNRLILHDCVVTNIGLAGTVNVDNCTFLFGHNVNNNNETIHCSDHSRITNCIFDGRENITGTPRLTHDVIDMFNGHDIIVDGCTFKAYSHAVDDNGEILTDGNLITVKSHYYSGDPNMSDQDQISNFIGPQNGVVIRNCFFDLPTFTGAAITVWNGPIDIPEQKREFNRQFTLIEGNYMEMPKAVAFVNCLRFSDYVTVRNNVGCVNNCLVNVNNQAKANNSDNRVKNKTHNLIIDGNILRYQKYTQSDVEKGMLILKGTYIENLVLENNSVEGSLWSMWPTDINGNLTGTVRVVNNESVGKELFRARVDENAVMPTDVLTFFSGNVSNGKKTDIGDKEMIKSTKDGLFFNGRQFFYTDLKKQGVYYDGFWYFADYKLALIEKSDSPKDC